MTHKTEQQAAFFVYSSYCFTVLTCGATRSSGAKIRMIGDSTVSDITTPSWNCRPRGATVRYPQCLSASAGLWTLHASDGRNIQLHFLDFDVEATYDFVEVRDGVEPNSTLLGEVFCLSC